MKSSTKFLCVLACFLGLAACGERDQASPLPPETAGKVVLVNYWAEWCHPCREEIPELNQLAARDPENLLVYGVNFDGVKGPGLAEIEARLGVEFPTLATDPATAFGLQPPTVLPVTLVINQTGKLVDQLQGKQTLETLTAAVAAVGE